MPYVPEDQRDTAWYIFNQKFMCRVRFIDTLSTDYIKIFGMPSIFDKHEDRATANELNEYYLTIAQIAEYFKRGINVRVVKEKDTKEIYERISQHLEAWKEELRTTFNIKDAPIDDLILLDELAVAVYQHAKHHFTREFVSSSLFNALTSVAASPLKVIKPVVDDARREKISNSNHNSMADVFNSFRGGMSFSQENNTPTESDPNKPFSWR